jgi:OOP family OmpA-OmpF porin
MKKILTLFAATIMAASLSAQTLNESKTFDNIYIGINGGLATKMTGNKWLKNLNPNAGLRVGRWFTPVFGLALETNAYFSNKPGQSTGTFVRGLNTGLLATVNFSNWFGGYKGEPRVFEFIPVYGLGWEHTFSNNGQVANNLTSKAGIDFTFNIGESKAWQIYVEPAVLWALTGTNYTNTQYNINRSYFQLNAGVVYKFKNSNDSHNFTIAQLRDQAEIDALNSQINDLRAELAKKPKEVVKEVEVIKEAPATVKEVKVENLVFVTFAQGKTSLTAEAKKALNAINEGKHVQIVGTASPEGSKEVNDRISQSRADVVAEYLRTRGVIVDEATGKGVQGTTSNRLAVVYVK